jgi:8-oxo-dGTP pyrophosphatase MutT (NUDIX family)
MIEESLITEGVSVLMLKGNQIFLSKRLNCTDFNGFWQSAGGKIEAGEIPAVAGVRELYEEAGIKADTDELINFGNLVLKTTARTYRAHFFIHHLQEGILPRNLEPDKHSDWILYDIKYMLCAKGSLLPGIKQKLLELIKNDQTMNNTIKDVNQAA